MKLNENDKIEVESMLVGMVDQVGVYFSMKTPWTGELVHIQRDRGEIEKVRDYLTLALSLLDNEKAGIEEPTLSDAASGEAVEDDALAVDGRAVPAKELDAAVDVASVQTPQES